MPPSAVVVGRMHGGMLDLVRVGRDSLSGRRTYLGFAAVPWEGGEALGQPLERLVHWRADEPVVIAVETPPLCGGSLIFRGSGPGDSGVPVGEREREEEISWRARDVGRERAAGYFSCSIEQVALLTEVIDRKVAGSSAAFDDCVVTELFTRKTAKGPLFTELAPPDVPDCHLVLLPVMVGELILSPSTGGLLLMEEEQLSFLVCASGVLHTVRSVPLGGYFLTEELQACLGCSPREATLLLDQMDLGSLSSSSTRSLARVLQSFSPLFRAAAKLLTEEIVPHEWVTHVSVTGLWPVVLHRLFYACRAAFQGIHPSATCRVLPRPRATSAEADETSSPRTSGRALLEHAVEAVFLTIESRSDETRSPVRAHAVDAREVRRT